MDGANTFQTMASRISCHPPLGTVVDVVKAVETSLRTLLEGSLQYQVPLYQRTYSWRKAQHERLWDDVVKLAEDRKVRPSTTHFIGSVVLASSPSSNPGDTSKYLIVDGQQRLTTLTILLAALRDHRAETEEPSHRDRINEQFLVNKWSKGQPLKLLPTQKDRDAYSACIHATAQAGSSHSIGAAYRYFRSELLDIGEDDDSVNVDQIEDAVLSGLALVSVVAEHGDNVHRIFESLNNTGLRLTQGDLIRNYLFMRLNSRAEDVYDRHWRHLETTLDSQQLELLFWLDLVQANDGAKQSDTYALQQVRLDALEGEEAIEQEVQRFARLGALLSHMLDPSEEHDSDVRVGLERLNAWGTVTVYPLMLNLLDRRQTGELSSKVVAEALHIVISYLVRRVLIGRATANLNRTLLRSVQEVVKSADPATSLRQFLSEGRKYFASDRAIRESITTIPFYWNGKAAQRKLILQWLDESLRPKERLDATHLTVEHVMPQTATDEWRALLAESLEPDEDVDTIYAALLHTIGNLTLTGYNSELSNSPFDVKREMLARSGVGMNHEIAKHQRWGKTQIQERSQLLAERIISIWPGPVDSAPDSGTTVLWDNLAKVLAEIPAGRWTTYGDVAAVLGTHAVPLGSRLANHPTHNAHRVLRSDGRIADSFRWSDSLRSDTPRELLEAEGVSFTLEGTADPSQRLSPEELAELSGLETDGDSQPERSGVEREDDFWDQMILQQPSDVTTGLRTLLAAWRHLGGGLMFGNSQTTSCFVLVEPTERKPWPFTIYPNGKVDVVFQHMAKRPPFDDLHLRQQFRDRLNVIEGIELPGDSLDKRPSFDLAILGRPEVLDELISAMAWFFVAAT